jgi:hypothetical protein
MNRNLDAALRYAAQGWPVFPCAPGTKVPLAGGHGVHDATTDPAQIRQWWTGDPRRNVAIATGAPGPDVLDIDVHGDATGFPALRRLRAAGLVPDAQTIVRTPSGGCHLWFRSTDQGNGTFARHHLDFRGRGGYVVAPPSAVNGREYTVLQQRGFSLLFDWSVARAFLPPPRREFRGPAATGTTIDRLAAWVERQEPGGRNSSL